MAPFGERLECANLRPEKKGLSSVPKQSLKILPISPIMKLCFSGEVHATPCNQSTQTENFGLDLVMAANEKMGGRLGGLSIPCV
jgi:hypothetical protein